MILGIMAITASAQLKSVDLKADLRSNFGIGAGVSLGIVDKLDFAPTFNYYFIDGCTNFAIEADFKYNFNVCNNLNVYPLAGPVLSYVSAGGFSDTDFGFDLGAGLSYDITKKLAVFGEWKYQYVGAGDNYFAVGVKIGL